jgi:hypothetical protein
LDFCSQKYFNIFSSRVQAWSEPAATNAPVKDEPVEAVLQWKKQKDEGDGSKVAIAFFFLFWISAAAQRSKEGDSSNTANTLFFFFLQRKKQKKEGDGSCRRRLLPLVELRYNTAQRRKRR